MHPKELRLNEKPEGYWPVSLIRDQPNAYIGNWKARRCDIICALDYSEERIDLEGI